MSHKLRISDGHAPFVTAYEVRAAHRVDFPDKGLTKQSFKDECNINLIMAKYQRTGLIDFVNTRQPEYGDASPVDFQTAMDIVIKGNQMFSELPSSWRKRFSNSPEEFVSFIENPANRDEAIAMGLMKAPEVPPAGDLSAGGASGAGQAEGASDAP